MVTGANEVVQINWQTVDITRPLSSLRKICLQESETFQSVRFSNVQSLLKCKKDGGHHTFTCSTQILELGLTKFYFYVLVLIFCCTSFGNGKITNLKHENEKMMGGVAVRDGGWKRWKLRNLPSFLWIFLCKLTLNVLPSHPTPHCCSPSRMGETFKTLQQRATHAAVPQIPSLLYFLTQEI